MDTSPGPTAPTRLEALEARLEVLERDAGKLASVLAEAAESLRVSGALATASLIEMLSIHTSGVESMSRDLEHAARAEGLGPVGGAEHTPRTLRRRLEEVVQARQRRQSSLDRRSRTVAALDRLAALVPVEESSALVAERLRSLTSTLLEQLRCAPDGDLDARLAKTAPFEALDRLVGERPALPMEAVTELAHRAATAVGLDVVLAVIDCRLVPPPENSAPNQTSPAAETRPEQVGASPLTGAGTTDAADGTERSPEAEAPPSATNPSPPVTEAEQAPEPQPAAEDTRLAEGRDEASRAGLAGPPPAPFSRVDGLKAEPAREAKEDEPKPPPTTTPHARAGEPGPSPTAEASPPRGKAGLAMSDAVAAIAAGRPGSWNDLLWCLVRDDRPGLAFHVSRYMELNDKETELPSELLEALALAPGLRSSGSEVVPKVRDALQLLSADPRRLVREALGPSRPTPPLMLAALVAALRPALLAQGTSAPKLLASLHFGPDLDSLATLRDVALGPSRSSLELTAAQLGGFSAAPRWQGELRELKEGADNWLSRERMSRVIYKAAADVWRRWLRDDGPIGRMLGRVLRDEWDDIALRAAKEEVRSWSDATHVDQMLRRTDLELRRIGAKRRPIDARAITSVRERCQEASDMVEAWLRLLDRKPAHDANWIDEQVIAYRRELSTAADHALAELKASDPGLGLPREAALAAARRAVEDLVALLEPDDPEESLPLPVQQLLGRDLLRVPGVELDDRWEPVDPSAEALGQGLLAVLSGMDQPWRDVLAGCWERMDFETAERVLELIGPDDPTPARGEKPTNVHVEHGRLLAEKRNELVGLREERRSEIEKARLKGLIDEDERLNLWNRLSAIEPEQSLRLDRARRELDEVYSDFRAKKRQRIATFEAQFQELDLPAAHAGHERVHRLLEVEDLVTAHEYLALLEAGNALPESESTVPGLDFFDPHGQDAQGDAFRWLEPLYFGKDRLNPREIARRLGIRVPLAGVDLAERLTPGQALQAQATMEDWNRLRFKSGGASDAVQRVLNYLGFRVKSLREVADPQRGATCLDLEAEPFESRNDCLLPDFGSRCHGRYLVVCLDGQPLEEEILKLTGLDRRSHPVIAFYLGAMSWRRRRDLAHALRRHPARRLLVLDDVLLLYVMLQKRRTPAFFHAASQFGIAEPYATTSAQIPPEMFFGRHREIESVYQPDGTNLVYGGRQLGKTALLNEVSRRYHRPDAGVVVELINLLHDEHIGLNRSLDDVWTVIAGRLQQYRIVNPSTRKTETLVEQIVLWLEADVSRRIVLLLDEADLFLNSDSKEGWPRVGKLKSLMERTGRRFKVVFAGLHNVQRTSHDVNTPLAHLGTAICVGPFLSHAELRDATDMVGLPLRALGYRFERPELVARVLAQANYYPSLIQILCQQLLKRLSNPRNPACDPNRTPPYPVRLSDLEDAFSDPEVRRQIYDRFRWTIELDNRYRVIALSLALESTEVATPSARGFTLAEIRDTALAYWPQGFSESSSNDAFRCLLDEMCELGVLRPREGGTYTMRSPNVVRLLGTRDDVWQALDDAARVPARIEYEAQSFRRVYDQHNKWRRSPLTAHQESQILAPSAHGLFVLLGTRAAGLEEVVPFLKNLVSTAEAGRMTVSVLDELIDVAAFRKKLDEVLQRRDDGVSLVVVDDHCPWAEEWVAAAADLLARRAAAKRRVVKVVFVGGPRAAWSWSVPTRDLRERLEHAGLLELSLGPWSDAAVRRWKKEAEFGEDNDEDSRRFRTLTGNWCAFLHEAGRRCLLRPHQWKSVVAEYHGELRDDEGDKALGAFEIVPEARSALRVMAQYGDPVDAEQLDLLTMDGEASSPDLATRILRWADSLALLRAAGEGRWGLDPFLAGLLDASSTNATG